MDTLIILCLLGDPTLPATSVRHTGGFQVDVQELLHTIQNPNCDIHIVTNTSKFRKIYTEKMETYTIHRIAFNDTWLTDQNLLMRNFSSIKQSFFDIFEKISCKNCLIHSFYWLSGILAYEAAKKYSVNYVHSVVSLSIGKTLSGSKAYYNEQFEWEKKFLKNAKMIFSITDTEKEQLLKYYDISSSLIRVVGRCVHSTFEFPCRTREGYPYNITEQNPIELMSYKWWIQGAFTYVGRIQEIKGLNYIIVAWLNLYETYKELTPPLWICGGIPENIQSFRCELQNQLDFEKLQKSEAEQKLVWWGYIDFAGLSTLYLRTKVLVTHSQYEPGGRVLLEAMAAAVPVIATPNGFAKDLIINNENGFLVEYGNINELSQKMEIFIKDSKASEKLGKNAKNTYLDQKKLWKCYQQQFEVYNENGLNSF